MAKAAGYTVAGCEEETKNNLNGNDATTLPDSLDSFVDLQAYTCGAANKCKGVFLNDLGYGVCDGKGGWVYGSLIYDMDCGIDYVPGFDNPLRLIRAKVWSGTM